MDLKNSLDKSFDDGKLEGQQEKAEKIAKKLKDKGMDIDEIIEITGLSREEIEKL